MKYLHFQAKAYQTIKVNFGRYVRNYLEQGLELDADKVWLNLLSFRSGFLFRAFL